MLRGIAAAAFLILPIATASAQDGEKPRKRDLLVTVGGGAQAYPRFPGSDDLKLSPLPIFDWRKEGEPISFEAPDEGIGFALIGEEGGFQMGPAVRLQGKRKERHVGAAVDDVGFTVEAGAFAQAYLSPSFRMRLEARRGLGGHEGWVGDLGADFVARNEDRTIFSVGPRLRFSNARYQRAYFGVTPAVAARTGVAVHTPGSGLHAVGAVAGLTHHFDESWGLYGYAGYDRLVGDAADSPIVRRFGSRSQPSVGLGLTYTFKVRRGRRD